MQRFKLSFLVNPMVAFALVLAPACGDDGGGDEGADTGDTETTTVSTTMTTTESTPMTSTTDSTDTTDGTETTDATETTDTTVDSTGTEEGPTTGGGAVCEDEPGDDECIMCTKAMCCNELEACAADAGCGCTLECLGELENPGIPEAMTCATECGADFIAISALLIAVQTCRDGMCAEPCGGA